MSRLPIQPLRTYYDVPADEVLPGKAISEHRTRLKYALLKSRASFFPGAGVVPICDACGGPITSQQPADAHEWLIKRSDVQSWPEDKQILIFHELNCGLIHHEPCHMQFGQTKAMTNLLAQKFQDRYSADTIIKWINSLPLSEAQKNEARLLIEKYRRDDLSKNTPLIVIETSTPLTAD